VGDIRDPGCAQRLVQRCLAATGRLDFLVNVAGVMQPDLPLHQLPLEAFERVLSVNLTGSFLCYRAAAEAMIRLKSGGAILNIVSTGGIRPVPKAGGYVASKHGLVGLTTTAALEVAAYGIRVNAICPGVTDTPLFRASISGSGPADAMKNQIPMRRIAEPREVANAAVWLLGDEASYVTGAVLPVDGGLMR
jgi:NAD(P)-dependent dehydrogenase (short-subunit alcohol dehydrogenase family)